MLVVGCGYLGARVADRCHDAGHEVTGVTLSEESAHRLAAGRPWRVRACDLGDGPRLRRLAGDGGPAVVVHCASSNRGGADAYRRVFLEGCLALSEGFPAARLVFCSSTSVYAQTDGSWVTEESPAEPERETGRILREAEERVLARGGCVARLAGIYGPGRSFVLRNLLEGRARIEGGGGEGRWLNQIHREDAADAVERLVSRGSAGIFNVSDDRPLTQRQCFEKLALRFGCSVPPVVPPDESRKRAWTNKRVANARLRATGWTPRYPDYFRALEQDPELVPSILAQVADSPPAMNVVLVGLMGSGKTSVGRVAAQSLGFEFVDTDQMIIESAGKSIPEIFADEGEEGFRRRETEALASLAGRERLVVATGGGVVTRPENHPLLRRLGFVVWLNADVGTLCRRTAHSQDRPLLREGDPEKTLRRLLAERAPLYEQVSDFKITTDDLSLPDAAYGLAESARVHFRGRQAS